MVYRCINSFELPLVDDDGYSTEENSPVGCNTLWKLEEESAYTLTGAEIRLISLDKAGFDWIEISKDRLKSNFEIEEE